MDDKKIIKLYFERSQKAIAETARKYGRYCHYIAFNIVGNDSDAEECVNDTYLRVWNAVPPTRPDNLQTFIGRIVRNLALNRYEKMSAQKRGAGQIPLILDELYECIPDKNSDKRIDDDIIIKRTIESFLSDLQADSRKIFIRRYWYMCSVKEIAEEYSISESKVCVSLYRARESLRKKLEEEGISV